MSFTASKAQTGSMRVAGSAKPFAAIPKQQMKSARPVSCSAQKVILTSVERLNVNARIPARLSTRYATCTLSIPPKQGLTLHIVYCTALYGPKLLFRIVRPRYCTLRPPLVCELSRSCQSYPRAWCMSITALTLVWSFQALSEFHHSTMCSATGHAQLQSTPSVDSTFRGHPNNVCAWRRLTRIHRRWCLNHQNLESRDLLL